MTAVIPALREVLEWRWQDSHTEITYTEFGPYCVECNPDFPPRLWFPDEVQSARIMVTGASDKEDGKRMVQADVDQRRAFKMVQDCAIYLDGTETPAQRIERERKDVEVLLLQIAKLKDQ